MLDSDRKRRKEQYQNSKKVNPSEVQDRIIFPEKLISDDSATNGGDIAPELKEVGQSGRRFLALANCSRYPTRVGVAILDVILERAR